MQFARLSKYGQGWIPVFVSAHDISREMIDGCVDLQTFLRTQLGVDGTHNPKSHTADFGVLVNDSFDRYRFLIIIDGLDEITDRPSYEHISRKLNALLETSWNSTGSWHRYIVSCRSDDNQRLISGRLVSIKPVSFRRLVKYLKRRARTLRARPGKRRELQNIITQLKHARVNRLLLNYTGNPYLLSLIIEYYKDLEAPPATHLRHVFEHVLERELRKPMQPHEGQASIDQRGGLRPYLTSILAPYCFAHLVSTLNKTTEPDRFLNKYLKSDRLIGAILFGGNGTAGYLRSVYCKNVIGREDSFELLSGRWGIAKTRWFRTTLEGLTSPSSTYEVFELNAIQQLCRDVLKELSQSHLATFEPNTNVITRFRHRRLYDFFVATYFDNEEFLIQADLGVPLRNGWLREPLRIAAAIARSPSALLVQLRAEYDSLLGELDTEEREQVTERWYERARLLSNASAAVAYLPRLEESGRTDAVAQIVTGFGTASLDLFNEIWLTLNDWETRKQESGAGDTEPARKAGTTISRQATKTTMVRKQDRRGWLDLERKCLTAISDSFASECVSDVTLMFDDLRSIDWGGQSKVVRSWHLLLSEVSSRSDSYQHAAFARLFPVAERQRRFPLKRSVLLFLVIDSAPFFAVQQKRMLVEAVTTAGYRAAFHTMFWAAHCISVGLLGLSCYWLLRVSESTGVRVTLFGLSSALMVCLGLAAERSGLMAFRESFQLPLWLGTWLFKQVVLLTGNAAYTLIAFRGEIARGLAKMVRFLAIAVPVVAVVLAVAWIIWTWVTPPMLSVMQATETWVEREWTKLPMMHREHERPRGQETREMSVQDIRERVARLDGQFGLTGLDRLSVTPDQRIRFNKNGLGGSSGLGPAELEASAKMLTHLSIDRDDVVNALHEIERSCADSSNTHNEKVREACRGYIYDARKRLRVISGIVAGNHTEALALATELEIEASVSRKAVEVRLRGVLSSLCLVCVSLFTFWYWRIRNDRQGRAQMTKLDDFEALLAFVARNHYSLAVNEEAVAVIQRIAPLEANSLRAISDAAERRLARLGDVNERIGNMLVEVATGLENILNRR
jgi:hypothetical protein